MGKTKRKVIERIFTWPVLVALVSLLLLFIIWVKPWWFPDDGCCDPLYSIKPLLQRAKDNPGTIFVSPLSFIFPPGYSLENNLVDGEGWDLLFYCGNELACEIPGNRESLTFTGRTESKASVYCPENESYCCIIVSDKGAIDIDDICGK